MTHYEQGFITKCAEYGIDAETASKMCKQAVNWAGLASRAMGSIGQAGRWVGRQLGNVGTWAGNQTGKLGKSFRSGVMKDFNAQKALAGKIRGKKAARTAMEAANQFKNRGLGQAKAISNAGQWMGRNNTAVGAGIVGGGALAAGGAAYGLAHRD